MSRRPPTSTPFPTRRSSDLKDVRHERLRIAVVEWEQARLHLHHDPVARQEHMIDRKSTRLNSSHTVISYAVFCLKKKTKSSYHAGSTQTPNSAPHRTSHRTS